MVMIILCMQYIVIVDDGNRSTRSDERPVNSVPFRYPQNMKGDVNQFLG